MLLTLIVLMSTRFELLRICMRQTFKAGHLGRRNNDPRIVSYNLRFPGQLYDGQAGLHQNYMQDLDPATGRYIESDPIGLNGGSWSTYAYVAGNPISNVDPRGLEVRYMCRPLEATRAFNHCFVYVTCPEEGWSDIYSLFPISPGNVGHKYSAVPGGPGMRDNPTSPSLAYNNVINPRGWPANPSSCGRCQFEKAVGDRFNSFTNDPVWYSLPGPNSNSFAAGLINMPEWGVSAPNVPGAQGYEYGWSAWPKPSNPTIGPVQ